MSLLPNGLQYASLLDGKGGLKEFDVDDVASWTAEQGPLWLHFDLTDESAAKWLKEHGGIDSIAVEALLSVDSRPRLTRVGKGALVALRGVNLNEGANPDDMIGIRIWVEESRIFSSTRRRLLSIEDILSGFELGDGPVNIPEVLTELASRLVRRMSDTVNTLEETIADLESRVLESTDRETRFALANLRRKIIALRRYLAPQREALSSLVASKISWLTDSHKLSLRETSDQLIRHLEDLDAIRERAAVTQEELQSRLAEQQNVRMYVLSIVAAVFLPLGFLTGLLGINVGGIPGSDDPKAFAVFIAILVFIVSLQIIYFRSKKWF